MDYGMVAWEFAMRFVVLPIGSGMSHKPSCKQIKRCPIKKVHRPVYLCSHRKSPVTPHARRTRKDAKARMVGDVQPRFDRHDHGRLQGGGRPDGGCVMDVHAQVVTDGVTVELPWVDGWVEGWVDEFY